MHSRVRRVAIALSVGLVTACSSPQVTTPSPTPGTPAPNATATPAVPAVASPTLPLTPTGSPAAVLRTELGGLLRTLATGWAPEGETVIVSQPAGLDGTVLVAVDVDPAGSKSSALVAFGQSVGWDVRRDGSSFAIALNTTPTSSRIAAWEPRTGAARWVSPDEPGILHGTPVWSADGTAIHYSAIRPPDGLGIFRFDVASGRATRIREPEDNGAQLVGLTPDGRGLVWSRIREGGSTEVLDLRTGNNTTFERDKTSRVAAWRASSPRALVVLGGCCAGPPLGTLVVWDDLGETSRAIYGRDLTPQEGVATADWDPEGKRIVAVIYDTTISLDRAGPLVTMDENGGTRSAIAGTDGAGDVRWLQAGIVYLKSAWPDYGEIFLVAPSGGTPKSAYRGAYISGWKFVSP